jgi:hypothetical protein
MLRLMRTAATRTPATAPAPSSSAHAREHPLLDAQRTIGNQAVAELVAQRQPAGARPRKGARKGDAPETESDAWLATAVVEALDTIFDTSRVLKTDVAAYPKYGNALWLLYQAYRSNTAGLFPGPERLKTYDQSMATLRPALDRFLSDPGQAEWYDNRLRARLERSRWDVEYGMASDRVKAEVEAGRATPGGTTAPLAPAPDNPAQAKALVDGYLAGVDKVKKVVSGEGGWDHKAARTRRKAGESKASASNRGDLDAMGELDRTSAVLKTASTLLTLTDDEFAKKLATLDARGPLGQARSRAEVAKVAVDLVNDGTKALHTALSVWAAKSGNGEALAQLRKFELGDMKRIGQLSSGVSILVSALTILDNPTSKEALEAGVDIVATAGKGTPLAKAKDVYDFGKNAATVLDEDATRAERIDGAMGMIGVAGPLGASMKLTYDGLKALGDLYWGASLGLVAAGVYPATKRLMMEAQGIGLDVEKLAATARLLEAETDPGQRAALQRIAENQINAIGKSTKQTILGALSRSDERDDPGNIRIIRELFGSSRRFASATDPEQVMESAIRVMRKAKWVAENQELVIRAEATNTSLPDAIEWKAEEARKAEKKQREAAEKKRKFEELTKAMPKEQREWLASMMGG